MQNKYFKVGEHRLKITGDLVLWVFAPQFNFELKIETQTIDHFTRIEHNLRPEPITQKEFEDYFIGATIKAAQIADSSENHPEILPLN